MESMKRIWIILFFITLTGCTSKDNQQSTSQTSQYKEQTVYVTNSGSKYHRNDCRYLKKSKKNIKLSKAKDNGYTACKVCKP